MGFGRQRIMDFSIDIEYDESDGVFMATSEDIKGLALEADSPEQMHKYLREIVPILLERNHGICLSEAGESHTS